jgi:hypothetical protein
LIGYVLFETFAEAVVAHRECGLVNTFLYPEVEPAHIIGGFSDNLRSRCVAVYGIDPSQKDSEIEKMFREIAPFEGIVIVKGANEKIALVHFRNRDGVASAFQSGGGFKRELLNAHIMIRAGELLRPHPCLVMVMGLGWAVNNAKLRTIFEATGRVRSATVLYNADNGSSADRALVFFEAEESARYACANPPIDGAFRIPISVMPYRLTGEMARGVPQAPAQAAPPPVKRSSNCRLVITGIAHPATD